MPLKPETAINLVIGVDSSFGYKYISEYPIYNDKIPNRKELDAFCANNYFDKLTEGQYKKLANSLELLISVRNDFGGYEYNNDIRDRLHDINVALYAVEKGVQKITETQDEENRQKFIATSNLKLRK